MKRIVIATAFVLAGTAHSATLLVAIDNSSSTEHARQEMALQCAAAFSDLAIKKQQFKEFKIITIGAASNSSLSESVKIGERNAHGYLKRETARDHFERKIRSLYKKLDEGKVRVDGSSAIFNGVFYDVAPLLSEGGAAVVCSDFIENEVSDVTKNPLPDPPKEALKGKVIYGVGFGLGLPSDKQNLIRKRWEKAMEYAGAEFHPMRVR